MSIQAPYRGRDNAPANADKASDPADKQKTEQEEVAEALQAAKRERAPQDEEQVATQDTEEEELAAEEEDESTEAPDDDPDEEELQRGYLRHADYTKKRQADAEAMKDFKARYGGYEVLDNFLTQNPQLAETHTLAQIVSMIQSPERVTATNQPSLSAEDRNSLNAVRSELRQGRTEIQQERETLFLERAEDLVVEFGRKFKMSRAEQRAFAQQAVNEEFIKPGMTREAMRRKLDILAKAATYRDAERKGQTKLVQKLKEKQKAASAGATAASPAPEPRTERPKGWDALIRKHTPE